LARLSDTVLNNVWTFLQSSQRIPSYRYGWFVLLLSELSQHPGRNTTSLQRCRATVKQTLCRWLQTNAGDRAVIDQGQHTSWLFAFLLLQLSAPTSPTVIADMNTLYGSTVANQRASWRSRAVSSGDFMHVPSIIETLDLLRGQTPWLTSARVTGFGGLGATGLSPGHEVGERITHAWPVAVLSRTDTTMCTLLQGFVRDWRAQPTNWQYRLSPVESLTTATTRFTNNSHWIPQFLWLTLRLRCP
jgi:hypothetical protein